MQLHDYQDETALSGRRVDFSGFSGKPVLFVNVASE
jgi:glutathione peroxidase-family protein